MDRYQKENACFHVEGYFLPRPNEAYKDAFERARQEFLLNMEVSLKNVKEIKFEEFLDVTVRRDPIEV